MLAAASAIADSDDFALVLVGPLDPLNFVDLVPNHVEGGLERELGFTCWVLESVDGASLVPEGVPLTVWRSPHGGDLRLVRGVHEVLGTGIQAPEDELAPAWVDEVLAVRSSEEQLSPPASLSSWVWHDDVDLSRCSLCNS